jgi:hypothetical protein
MRLKFDPCFKGLEDIITREGTRSEIVGFLNTPCRRTACPIHGAGGIANTLLQLLDELSNEELADSLRRTMRGRS